VTRTLSLVTAAAGVLLLAGCSASVSTSNTLDNAKLQDEIKSGIERQIPKADVTSVSCPDDVEIKKGGTFTCTVAASGGSTGTVDVTMTDDEGNVHWTLPKA
jgi:hypothetical protein